MLWSAAYQIKKNIIRLDRRTANSNFEERKKFTPKKIKIIIHKNYYSTIFQNTWLKKT